MGWLFDEDSLLHKPATHMGAYTLHKKTKVTAVCDTDTARLQGISKKYNIRNVYMDYKKMLSKEKLDIVSICTPADMHAKECILAAESGVRAIFCEKPIAITIEQAEDMIAVCRKNNVKLIINYPRRWDSRFSAVKEIIAQDKIGKIDLVSAFSGVGLLNSGTHLFDLLRQYFGNMEFVSGSIIPEAGSDPGGRGIVKFRNGPFCFVDSSWRNYLSFEVNIYGENGMLRASGPVWNSKIELYIGKKSKKESGIKELEPAPHKMPRWTPPIFNAVKNIVNSLEKEEKILCTGEDGKAALEVAICFHESAKKQDKKMVLHPKYKRLKIIPRETSFVKNGILK